MLSIFNVERVRCSTGMSQGFQAVDIWNVIEDRDFDFCSVFWISHCLTQTKPWSDAPENCGWARDARIKFAQRQRRHTSWCGLVDGSHLAKCTKKGELAVSKGMF